MDHNERISDLEAAVADLQAKAGIAPAPVEAPAEMNVGTTSTTESPAS